MRGPPTHASCVHPSVPSPPQLIGHLRKQMPAMFGTQKAQKKLMDDIITNFEAVGAREGRGARAGCGNTL